MTDPHAPTATDPADPAIAVEDQAPPRRRRRWRWIVGTVVTFLVLGGLYLAAYLYAGTTVPKGTTVLGIDIGGQTQEEAEATLTTELPPVADAEIPLLVEEDSYPVVPSESGLNVDVTATVRAAGPGASDPIRLVEVIARGGGPVDPVVVVDRDALAAAIDEVADTADRTPVEGAVAFDAGEVVATLPVEGRQVQREESVDLVAESYLVETGPIPLPVDAQPTLVSEDEVTRAVAEFAEPAMSGPVPLVSEVGSSELGTELLSGVLSMPADEDGVLVPRVDADALLEQSADQLDAVGVPAVNASVRIESGTPVVVAGQTGRTPDTSTYADDVLAAAVQSGDARTVTLPLVDAEPEFTTADAEASGVRQVVSEFTIPYPGDAEYRNINIGRAADLANNTFLRPGDTFSMNGVVGERTPERGFVEGGVINNGRYSSGVGGGISQLATTLYNAAYFAGFEDVEHHPHSFYIDRYPVGREATVSWGLLDLRFRNNTPYGAVVQSFIARSTPSSPGSVTVRIWSTPYWQVDSVTGNRFNPTPYERLVISASDCRASSGSNGFDIVVTRTLSRDGTVQAREEILTRYEPTPEVVCT